MNPNVPFNFDATTVEPNSGAGTILPDGDYLAVIDESGWVPTNADQNILYAKLRFSVVEGQFTGSKVFTNLNLNHPNETPKKIAMGDLSAICHATGVMQINHLQLLHNKPLTITVKTKQDPTGKYGPQNEIKKYSKATAGAQAVHQAPSAPVNTPPDQPAQPVAAQPTPPATAPAYPATPHAQPADPVASAPAQPQAPAPQPAQPTPATGQPLSATAPWGAQV